MDDIEQARLKQLERGIPDIWNDIGTNEATRRVRNDPTPSILYIGAYQKRFHFYNRIRKASFQMDLIEIDRRACDWLETVWLVKNVYCCDIRTYIELIDLDAEMHKYHTIIWSHGVETLPKLDGEKILTNLEYLAGKLIVNMVPFGAAGGSGNVSIWYPKNFEDMGYKTDTLGNEGELNSNLLAWKYK